MVDTTAALDAVACTETIVRCTAVDVLVSEVTFDPQNPGTPTVTTIDSTPRLSGVACPTTGRCTAVDEVGQEVTFDPTSPANPASANIDGRDSRDIRQSGG